MNASIRPALPDDLQHLRPLLSRTVESMLANGNPQWNETYPAITLEADLQKGELHVIGDDGGISGMIVINEDFPAEYTAASWTCSGRFLVVHRLAIDPVHQGKKLASKLMDFAEDEAGAWGITASGWILSPATLPPWLSMKNGAIERRGWSTFETLISFATRNRSCR